MSTPSWNEILVIVGSGTLSVIIFLLLMIVAVRLADRSRSKSH